jgi:hypothetical protein
MVREVRRVEFAGPPDRLPSTASAIPEKVVTMPYTRTSAKALLTAAELELYDMGRRETIAQLDRRTLIAKIKRTRNLRDKYRDLYRRQRLEARERTGAKRGLSGVANVRTREKAELFGELLARFEAKLAKVDAAAKLAAEREARARAAAEKAALRARKGPAAKGPKAVAPRAGFVSPRAKSAVAKRQFQKTRMTTIHAHVRSRGKRQQAKRDGRPR